MKIVYVVESLELGGGVKVILEHAEGLAARGHDVSIVTKDGRHDWRKVGVPVLEVSRFDETTLPEADVHVATWFPTVVPAVRAGRARKVIHFCQGYEAPHPHAFHRLGEIAEAYAQKVPKIVVSPHLKRTLEPLYPGPFHVIRQALPAADFAPREERNGPREPATIGVVGPFLSVKKGIDVALKAVRRLAGEGRAVRLHRASHMPLDERERLLFAPDEYGLLIPGTAMPAWYHRLDLLLHPSYDAEGFPLPPLEAMASGVPVVLTDIPSFESLPGDSVARVPEGDDEAMAFEAARLLDDAGLWRERRRRGLEVAGTFRLAPVLDELERIFSETLREV
jgi:glycosyltransferase involved in cell wall biosynthesis